MRGVEGRIFEEFSPGYYGICTVGGMLSAGATQLAVTPLDVLKVNMQVSSRVINPKEGTLKNYTQMGICSDLFICVGFVVAEFGSCCVAPI